MRFSRFPVSQTEPGYSSGPPGRALVGLAHVMHRSVLQHILVGSRLRILRVVCRIQGKRPLHLLHIGKTGGSAIKHALRRYPTIGRVVVFLHSHSVRLDEVPRGDSVVFFLRDPLTRFVSAFYSRNRQGLPRYFSPWSSGEREAFNYFRTPNQLATAISSSDPEERGRAYRAMRAIQHVGTSYWYWFKDEEYFRLRLPDIFFIGFQERLEEDFRILRSKLGLPDDLRLPDDDIIAHRNPSGLDTTLADGAIENLKEWYARDFAFVSLCEEVISQQPALRGTAVP